MMYVSTADPLRADDATCASTHAPTPRPFPREPDCSARVHLVRAACFAPHLLRCRILRRFFCRRRVRFFFHFQRIFDRAFLKGFDLWPMTTCCDYLVLHYFLICSVEL